MTVLLDSLYNSVISPVFLFEITASDGGLVAPARKPLTLGKFVMGKLPYSAAGSGETKFYFSDADWTERQSQPPQLVLDFTDSMPAGLTFTRTGNAWGWDASGQFVQYGNNVPRVAQTDETGARRGLLMEGTRTNVVDNAVASGAVVGVVGGSGQLPDGWFGEWDAGLTWTVTGSGTENGMPYVDVNFSGLGATSSPIIIQLVGFYLVPAASGQVWSGSVFVKQVGGTLSNVNGFSCRVSGFETGGGTQTEASETDFAVNSDRFTRGQHTRTLNNPATDSATTELCMDIVLGQPVDITLRISLPQLEQGDFCSSPIVTTTVPVTRNADSCYMATNPAWWSATANMVAAEIMLPDTNAAATGSRYIYAVDDNSAANLVAVRVIGTGTKLVTFIAGPQTVDIGGDVIADGSTFRAAARHKSASHRLRTQTGAASYTSAAAGLPTVNQLCIGNRARTLGQLFGYVDKLLIWKDVDNDGQVDGLPYGGLPPVWSAPTSARENVHYEGRCDTLNMDRTIPLIPESQSRSAVSIGDIRINNTDGFFDSLTQTYAVDGRKIEVLMLPDHSYQFMQAVPVFEGVGVRWTPDNDELVLEVREKSFFLDVPLLGLFGGTGNGDGNSANVGHVIPQAYGLCRNIVAELVDPAKLIYRFHDRAASDVLAVYDRGAPITKATNHASYAALSAASTAAGTFDYALTTTGSYYRLGSSPSGTVTADVRGDALGGYVGTTGAILQRIMLRGTVIGNVNTASLADIDTALPGEIGCYFNQQMDISEALDQVTSATFTFWGDIGDGTIGAYELTDPTGQTPDWELNEYAIAGEITPIALPESIGPTVWRRRIGFRINWNALSGTDIVPAPTITDARRKELQESYQIVSVADSARLVKNMLAVDAPILVTVFDASADATALGNRLLALYKPDRKLWNVPVSLAGYQIRLNDVILMKWPRFGLASGVLVRVVGISYQGATVVLTVFG